MPSGPIPLDDAARIASLHRYSILDTLPEQEYEDVVALASYVCGTPISLISLVDENRQWFKSRVGLTVDETPRAESFCAHTLTQPKTLVVEDTLLDERFADNPLVTGNPKMRFYAGAPIINAAGYVLGTVCVIDTKPNALSGKQIKALESLSRQVMTLLEARLLLSDNKKAAAALMQSEKLAAVGRMASSLAHEINNPLEAITNLLFLARQHAAKPDVAGWLDQAELELRRVSVIANQTLRFHKQATNPREISCVDLYSTILDLYEAKLRNRGIRVEKRKRAMQPVACFEGDVRQVLSNLIANAIDAMPDGGCLYVRSREGTDWRTGRKGIALTLADNGIGMSDATRSRIFEAFFTTKGIGGAGLGLWISADVMMRHDGRILIRSSQRKNASGTAVSLFLPFSTNARTNEAANEPAAVLST